MKNEEKKSKAERTLPPETVKKVQELLLRMNSHTEYSQTKYKYNSKILSGLVSKDGSLVDVSCILQPVKEIYEGCARIETGKLVIEINPKNGEIIEAKKPWFFSWNKFCKKLEALVDNLNSNFDNTEVIEKRSLPLSGLTKEGLEKIKEESAKIKAQT